MAKTYILRGLTEEQAQDLTKAGERAQAEGRSLKWVILRLLRAYARKESADEVTRN